MRPPEPEEVPVEVDRAPGSDRGGYVQGKDLHGPADFSSRLEVSKAETSHSAGLAPPKRVGAMAPPLAACLIPPPLGLVYKAPREQPWHSTAHTSEAGTQLHLQLQHLCS